ncbi:hypothetical protein RB213_002778 [Colletotrichum asianum]
MRLLGPEKEETESSGRLKGEARPDGYTEHGPEL